MKQNIAYVVAASVIAFGLSTFDAKAQSTGSDEASEPSKTQPELLASSDQAESSQGVQPAVPAPLLVRLGRQYTHRDGYDGRVNSNLWTGSITTATPFDFGLTDSTFLDQFGWHFNAQYTRNEDRLNSYSALVQPFWRDQDIGYVELNGRINHVEFDKGVSNPSNRSDTTYIASLAGGVYLIEDFTLGANLTYRDHESSESASVGGFVRYYPPFEPFDHNVSFVLGGNYTEIDPDRAGRPTTHAENIFYRVNWLLFPEEENAVSLFVGGSQAFAENQGSTSQTVTAGFVIWLGKAGTLYERSRWY